MLFVHALQLFTNVVVQQDKQKIDDQRKREKYDRNTWRQLYNTNINVIIKLRYYITLWYGYFSRKPYVLSYTIIS